MYKVVFNCLGKIETLYCEKVDINIPHLFVTIGKIRGSIKAVSAYPMINENLSAERFQNTTDIILPHHSILVIERLKEFELGGSNVVLIKGGKNGKGNREH